MNGLLAIAAAFLDLMTNPQHGIEVNEEYSLRFHQALIDDPEFANSFATLALSAEDIESLPICAWPWYLQWRAGNGSPPSRDFLDALFDYTDDPAIRLSVVRSAVWEEYPASTPADHPPADAEHRSDDDSGDRRFTGADPQPSDAVAERERRRNVQNPWLRARTTRMVSAAGAARGQADASEIATYLLQLGDPASLESLRALIQDEPWAGRESVVATVQRHIAEAGLDRETATRWRAQLGLANPGGTA